MPAVPFFGRLPRPGLAVHPVLPPRRHRRRHHREEAIPTFSERVAVTTSSSAPARATLGRTFGRRRGCRSWRRGFRRGWGARWDRRAFVNSTSRTAPPRGRIGNKPPGRRSPRHSAAVFLYPRTTGG